MVPECRGVEARCPCTALFLGCQLLLSAASVPSAPLIAAVACADPQVCVHHASAPFSFYQPLWPPCPNLFPGCGGTAGGCPLWQDVCLHMGISARCPDLCSTLAVQV